MLHPLRLLWVTWHEIVDEQGSLPDTKTPVRDPYQQAQEFTIAHYEWRHAEVPDELLGDAADA